MARAHVCPACGHGAAGAEELRSHMFSSRKCCRAVDPLAHPERLRGCGSDSGAGLDTPATQSTAGYEELSEAVSAAVDLDESFQELIRAAKEVSTSTLQILDVPTGFTSESLQLGLREFGATKCSLDREHDAAEVVFQTEDGPERARTQAQGRGLVMQVQGGLCWDLLVEGSDLRMRQRQGPMPGDAAAGPGPPGLGVARHPAPGPWDARADTEWAEESWAIEWAAPQSTPNWLDPRSTAAAVYGPDPSRPLPPWAQPRAPAWAPGPTPVWAPGSSFEPALPYGRQPGPDPGSFLPGLARTSQSQGRPAATSAERGLEHPWAARHAATGAPRTGPGVSAEAPQRRATQPGTDTESFMSSLGRPTGKDPGVLSAHPSPWGGGVGSGVRGRDAAAEAVVEALPDASAGRDCDTHRDPKPGKCKPCGCTVTCYECASLALECKKCQREVDSVVQMK